MIKYSLDDECFKYDTRLGTIFEMGDPKIGDVYYSAEAEYVIAEDLIRTYQIVEQIQDHFYDMTGIEDCNYIFTLSSEANDNLRNVLTDWIDKHLDIHKYFCITSKSTKHFVTAEDMKELNK